MILSGDIGGTKTRLALFETQGKRLVRKDVQTYQSQDYQALADIVRAFQNEHQGTVDIACLGVPGPVANGRAYATNLPWMIEESQLEKASGIADVKLVNDLAATAAAIPQLSSDDLLTLYKGKRPQSSVVKYGVLAPGTGLGQAFLEVNEAGKQRAFASEGGHVDFAPRTGLEVELFLYLKSKFHRVSYERVLSGPGLQNIYDFLKDKGHAPEPPELAAMLQDGDRGAVISSTGQAGHYEISAKALDMFAAILGAQAGNMVLTFLATGGIFLGGGIPPKICQKLEDGTTLGAYLDKGRLSNIVKDTPLHIIRDDHAALLGAASMASYMIKND